MKLSSVSNKSFDKDALECIKKINNGGISEFESNPDYTVIVNNEKCFVAENKQTGDKIYSFFAPAEAALMSSDGPATVYKSENMILIYIPENARSVMKFTVYRHELDLTERDDNVETDMVDARTHITVHTEGKEGTVATLKFKAYRPSPDYKVYYSEEDYKHFFDITKNGAAAFIYSKKFLVNGERYTYPEEGGRAIAKGGVIYVPVSFFEKHLGFDLSDMPADMFTYDKSVRCVSAMRCAEALGLSARVFYYDRLFVVADEAALSEIGSDSNLEEAGAYAVFGKYDASVFTSEDYKLAKDQWRLRLVGSKEINDLNDENIVAKIKAVSEKCKAALDTYHSEPDRVILWGDAAPTETEHMGLQYSKIECLARGYGTYGSDYYHDEKVLKIILDSLEWMYENMYGEAEIEGRGWRDVHAFNWWHWYVGVPENLTNIMLIVEDHLTAEDKAKYLKCYKWVKTVMYTGVMDRGANSGRLLAGARCALLLEDGEELEKLHVDCDCTMGVSEYGAGIHQADFVNWTHNYPHNISYGVIHIERGLRTASVLDSTPLDISGPKRYNQFNIIRYTYEPAMYRTQGFVMFSGRSTFRNEVDFGAAILAASVPMIGCFGEDEDRYIKRFIKRNASTPEIMKLVKSKCSIYDCAMLNSIFADDTISAENDYEHAHAWFTGDRASQQRADYAIGIAMSSKREKSYECINGANKTGWYTGDGSHYLYTRYDINQHDGKNFLLNNENIAYHFPGTTEDSQPRAVRSIATKYHYIPENEFAGSLSVGDKYLVAGMDFIAFHNEGPDVQPDDYGYGGSHPVHDNDLVAKKSWFCFDGEMLCLGAGINSTMNSPVSTTVEHRRIVNAGEDKQFASFGGEITELSRDNFETESENMRWALMDGHAGYIFPRECKTSVKRYTHEPAENQDFFELRILHGENPKGAKYEYVIMPYATPEGLDEYYASPKVRVISNTPVCQAAEKASAGVSFYVFYGAAEVEGVKVSAPSILAIERRGEESVLSVSDPTHKGKLVTVTLDGEKTVLNKAQNMTVNTRDGKTEITVNVRFAHGRKFEITYK